MFETVTRLQAELDALRPLPPHTAATLHEQLVLEWTYNSNAIEGNTLTLKETKVVLEGITIGGKPMREHFEAINHKEAIEYVESVVAGDEPMTQHLIKSIHQLILKNIDNSNAGVYRRENVVISGASHVPPNHVLIAEQMAALVDWYKTFSGHPIERAARLHVDFVKIHPFVDGNGRTARLLMNFDLMKEGYQPVVIQAADRLSYFQVLDEALDKAHTSEEYEEFLELLIKAEETALKRILSIVM
jgi:Fic family protein